MPFDGNILTYSPMAELDAKIRQLTIDAKRREAREYYAEAKLPPKRRPMPQISDRRAMKARESVIVLDLLEKLFAGGKNWCQNTLSDGHGRYCLVGGLRYIRSIRGSGDHAGVYLSRAISIAYVTGCPLIELNDGSDRYGEVRAMILFARQLAQQVVDKSTGQFGLALPVTS